MCASGSKPDISDEVIGFFGVGAIGQTEIDEFDPVIVVVNHQILRFQVTVKVACLVEQFDHFEGLKGDEGDGRQGKLLLFGDEVFVDGVI